MQNKKIWIQAAIAGVLVVAAATYPISSWMVAEKNPTPNTSVSFGTAADKILQESCYDCHSNQTEWPWYSNLPGMNVSIYHHVAEGREHLNFSEWDTYSAEDQNELAEEILEEIEEQEMPLWEYTLLHGGSEITAQELAVLAQAFQPMADNAVEGNNDHDHGDDDDDDDDDDD